MKLKFISIMTTIILSLSLVGCSSNKQVIIYSNSDEEAKIAMQTALDNNGFKGKYIFQSFGTSELGGKLIAEGKNIEADLITMSSYYVESAQEQNNMFLKLDFKSKPLQKTSDFYTPIIATEGTIIYNTEVVKQNNISLPTSFKDLSSPTYNGIISVTDITGSSTAWLLVQAIVDTYGEGDEGKEVMSGILSNAGAHLESSGSAPIKKIRAGEVALGFGLRHQAVADKQKGLPINYIDPIEGNFSLVESIAVINKGDKTNSEAMKMAECIVKNARSEIIKTYPIPLYEGEIVPQESISTYPKVFKEKLTVNLLQQHQQFSEDCKK